MSVNSRRKGKTGELAAVAYLKSLGFEDARRGQQFRGGPDSPDVIVPSLPRAHFEVKFGRPREAFDLGTELLARAVSQARRECAEGKTWFVLWKPRGCRQWRMTMELPVGRLATFADDVAIHDALCLEKQEA